MTIAVASDGYLGGSPLSISVSGYLGIAGAVAVAYYGGGGGAGATWEGWNDGETDADTIRLKNAQIINIVAAMVTSGILSCH